MATWHQLQRPTTLYHPTDWTVVEDPPNDCRALTTFATREDAEHWRDKMKALRPTWSIYVLQPGNPFTGKNGRR